MRNSSTSERGPDDSGSEPIHFVANRVAICQIARQVDANPIGTRAILAAISQIAAGIASVSITLAATRAAKCQIAARNFEGRMKIMSDDRHRFPALLGS